MLVSPRSVRLCRAHSRPTTAFPPRTKGAAQSQPGATPRVTNTNKLKPLKGRSNLNTPIPTLQSRHSNAKANRYLQPNRSATFEPRVERAFRAGTLGQPRRESKNADAANGQRQHREERGRIPSPAFQADSSALPAHRPSLQRWCEIAVQVFISCFQFSPFQRACSGVALSALLEGSHQLPNPYHKRSFRNQIPFTAQTPQIQNRDTQTRISPHQRCPPVPARGTAPGHKHTQTQALKRRPNLTATNVSSSAHPDCKIRAEGGANSSSDTLGQPRQASAL